MAPTELASEQLAAEIDDMRKLLPRGHWYVDVGPSEGEATLFAASSDDPKAADVWLAEMYEDVPNSVEVARLIAVLINNLPEITSSLRDHAALVAERDEASRERDNWTDTAAQWLRNTEFYRGIVVQIGSHFGDAAKTSNDGSVQEDVLALKVPELVSALVADLSRVTAERDALQARLDVRDAVMNDRMNIAAGMMEGHMQKVREFYKE